MKKHILSLLLAIALLAAALPLQVLAAEEAFALEEFYPGQVVNEDLRTWDDDWDDDEGATDGYAIAAFPDSGDLPDGLELKIFASNDSEKSKGDKLEDGDRIHLSGTVAVTPSQYSGSFTLELEAHDWNGEDDPAPTKSFTFHWTIHQCEIGVHPPTLPAGRVGSSYSVTLRSCKPGSSDGWCGSGEEGETVSFDDITGLPPGLTASKSGGPVETVTISGTPTAAGTYSFPVVVSGEVSSPDPTQGNHSG